MENVRRMTMLLTLVLAGMMIPTRSAQGQDAATPAQGDQPLAKTWAASCLLKITTDTDVLLLNSQAIDYLFKSSGVRDRAAREVLGLSLDQATDKRLLTLNVLHQAETGEPVSERQILVMLEVATIEGAKPAAREFMTAVITNFRNAVGEASRSEFQRLEEQIQLTDREVQLAEEELAKTQAEAMAISQQDLSTEGLRTSITGITSQLQAIQMDKATKEAYRQALAERISQIRIETEKSLNEDMIASELRQIIERRLVELMNVRKMVDSGRATPMELNAEEDKLAQAKIELARRREELAKAGSAATLGQLTGELATMTLDSAQAQAREKQLNIQLEQARDLLGRAGDYERMTLKLSVAKRNLQEALMQNDRARQRARMFHGPSVSVIGG